MGLTASLDIRICGFQKQSGREVVCVSEPVWTYEFVGFRDSLDVRLCGSQSQSGHKNLWISEPVWT